MNTDKAVELSVKKLLDEMIVLDGPDGEGGGLIKRSMSPWMTLSAQLTRNYAIYYWLTRVALHPEDLSDGQMKDAYLKLHSSLWAVSLRTPILLRALGKLASQKEKPGGVPTTAPRILGGFRVLSWYEDPDYWECAVLFAGASAAFATGQVIEGIGLAAAASEECREFLDKYEKGDGQEGGDEPDPKP